MGFWSWVLVFAVLGVLALVVFVLLALRLWQKARALMSQVGQLTRELDMAALDRQPADEDWAAAARRGAAR